MPQGFGAATPKTLSMDPSDYWRRAKSVASDIGTAIVETPARLKRAFTFDGAPAAPDAMTGISNTAVSGAKGFQNVKRMLKKGGEE